jgi:H/ACA ribonucleoprotein complex subunit 3
MRILKCVGCGHYSLKNSCPLCSEKTVRVGPARFSPQDRYGRYRRLLREEVEGG